MESQLDQWIDIHRSPLFSWRAVAVGIRMKFKIRIKKRGAVLGTEG